MKLTLLIFLSAVLSTSCGSLGDRTEQNSSPIVTLEQLEQQLEEIQTFIAQGKCTGSGQCSFIPYGKKACGGPQGFLIFSTDVNLEKLRLLVKNYTDAEILYNEQNQVMSDCSLAPEPIELACVNGDCKRIR